MTNRQVDEVILRYSVDSAALNQTLRSIETLERNFKSLGSEVGRDSNTLKQLEAGAASIRRLQSIEEVTREFHQFGQQVGNSRLALAQLRASLNDIGATTADIDRATAAFNRMENAARGAKGGASGARGGVNVGSLLANAGQLLPGEAGDLARTASDVEGVIGSVAGLGVAAIPLGVAAAAGALAFGQMTAEIETTHKATERYVKGLEEERDRRIELRRLIEQGSTEDVTNRSKELQAQATDLAEQITEVEAKRIENERQYAELGGQLNVTRRRQLIDEHDQLTAELIRLGELSKKVGAELGTLNVDALPAIQARERELAVAQNRIDLIQKEVDIQEQANAVSEQSSEQIEARGVALYQESAAIEKQIIALLEVADVTGLAYKEVEKLRQKQQDLIGVANLLTGAILEEAKAREHEAAVLKAQEEIEKFVGKTRANAAKEFAQVSEERIKAEEDLNAVMAERARQDERAAAIGDLENQIAAAKEREAAEDRNEARQQVEADFMADELKALAAYHDEVLKDQRDFARARARILEDAEDDLLSLASKGDVAGFIARQKQAEKDLKRQAEDGDEAQKERDKQFREQRAEALRQYRQQMDDFKREGQNRIRESARLERALSDLKATYAREDAARQRQIQDQEMQNNIAALREREAILRPVVLEMIESGPLAAMREFVDKSTLWMQELIAVVPGSSSSSSSYAASPSSGYVPGGRGFADGGIARAGQRILVGERGMEYVDLFPRGGARVTPIGGGGENITVNINNPMFGAIATPADVAAAKRELQSDVVAGIRKARGLN